MNDNPPPPSRRPLRRLWIGLLFAIPLTGSSWLTPVTPYLTLEDESRYQFCFSADSRLLASADGVNKTLVWDTTTGRVIAERNGGAVWDFRFSPDGKCLVLQTARDGSRDAHILSFW